SRNQKRPPTTSHRSRCHRRTADYRWIIHPVIRVWELYWTNLGANREAQAHRDTMSEMFDTQYEAGFNGNGPDPSVPEHADDAWGLLYVPRFGADYSVPVLDGTGEEINSAVLGRYSTSPRPRQDGNLAL